MKRKTQWSILIFGLLCASFVRAETNVDNIVRLALEQDELLRQKRQVYEYELTVLTEKLERNGHVYDKRSSKTVVRPGKAIRFEAIPDQTDQKRIKESQKIMATMNLKKLAPRFSLSLGKDAVVNGVDCHVVRFQPKPDQPFDSREEKVINHLAGKFWISKENHAIVRAEGRLSRPVSVAWFFATMREVHFIYETDPLPNKDLGPARFYLLYDLQTTVTYSRRRQTSTMRNYRLADS